MPSKGVVRRPTPLILIGPGWRCAGRAVTIHHVYAMVIGFVAGVAAFQQLPELPGPAFWWMVAAAASAAGLAATRASRSGLMALALLAGFAWAGGRAELRLDEELPAALEGQDLRIEGVVASLPEVGRGATSFEFQVERSDVALPTRLLLGWYGDPGSSGRAPPALHPGERWSLAVRLKRPHGRFNPHGPDFEAKLLEQGLRATGYVRARESAQRLATGAGGWRVGLERVRERLRDRFLRDLGERPWAGLLAAITLGDQQSIPPEQWRLFQQTGIVHLAVVSGLHVTMVAGFAGLLVAGLWRRTRLALRLPAQKAGMVAGLASAWAYALLSGLGIPVQRSVLMLSVAALCLWRDRSPSSARVLALALAAVVVVDPWAVLAPGFWLSFLAVAVLLLLARAAGRRREPPAVTAVKAQLAINLAMVPALLVFFQQFSLIAPLVNLVAVPVVSLVVLPLCLLYVVIPLPLLAQVAHGVAARLMDVAAGVAETGLAVWEQAVPPPLLVLAGGAACLWCVLPRGTPGRVGAAFGVLALVTYQPSRPAPGAFQVTTLDVGQGLAIHVRTASQDLLFDTGPRWPGGDAGQGAVLPYLRAVGARRLDVLVVSHADADHAGGTGSVVAGLPVGERWSHAGAVGTLLGAPGPWRNCSQGGGWEVDQVRFRWLNPPFPSADWPGGSDNDRSCVLRVESRYGSALLTADVEAAVEARLAATVPAALAADLVLAPHHGSRSSSSDALVYASGAAAVVFSSGYRSPYGHPHPEVWARWSGAGARAFRTDSQGAVVASFDERGMQLSTERQRRSRYWHGR